MRLETTIFVECKPLQSGLVSIERRIIELLNSLIALKQDKDFEVIAVVDDGSFVDLLLPVETFKEMLNIQYFKKRILDLVCRNLSKSPKMIGWFCRF